MIKLQKVAHVNNDACMSSTLQSLAAFLAFDSLGPLFVRDNILECALK